MDLSLRYSETKRITLLGAVVNAFLGIIKIITGTIGHSHALVADGVHSLSDLLTDALVLVASRYGSQDADSDHPYGHGRIETAATLFLALLLTAVGAGIVYDAFNHLAASTPRNINLAVLGVALFSILSKEALYQYTLRVANKLQSELLKANAWHHRSDALSSIIVLIAIAGIYLGFHYLDAIAAILVGGMIIKMGWELGRSSTRELVDTAVDDDCLARIEATIQACPGVKTVHQLRTRSMSGSVLVDVHILVDSELTVSEGHHIAQRVHATLRNQIKEINDVTVHVDPEDDEVACPSLHLPHRDQLLQMVNQHWSSIQWVHDIIKIRFHYIDGLVNIEVYLPLALHEKVSAKEAQQQLLTALKDVEYIRELRIFYATTNLE